MGHYGIGSKLQAQRRYEQRHRLRHFVGLYCRRGKLPQVGIIAMVGLRPQPAAQGDGDTAAVATPGVAFVLQQAAASAVDCAVGVDIEVVVSEIICGCSASIAVPPFLRLKAAADTGPAVLLLTLTKYISFLEKIRLTVEKKFFIFFART